MERRANVCIAHFNQDPRRFYLFAGHRDEYISFMEVTPYFQNDIRIY